MESQYEFHMHLGHDGHTRRSGHVLLTHEEAT